jgi:hypothetical protein
VGKVGEAMRTHKVRIIYKSGAEITFRCDNFTVTHSGSDITGVKWDNPKPEPMHIGVGEIVAVWKLS